VVNHYLNTSTHQNLINFNGKKLQEIKQKCSSVADERCVLSNGLSIATCNSQKRVIRLKNL